MNDINPTDGIDSTTARPPSMTPQQFIDKWSNTRFGEKQAAQIWFTDLLQLVGHPDPIEYGDRENFTFERPVLGGFADAYKQGHFVWEFKSAEPQLLGAFDQLLRYQVYLQTPPLLVVSSFSLIRIQTNFPGKETVVHDIPIAELTNSEQFNKLRSIFFAPQEFDPGRTPEDVTKETALLFKDIVEDMERFRPADERLAKYLNQIVFCLYAEDTGLLRKDLFTDITENHYRDPPRFNQAVNRLFAEMSAGGMFGADVVRHFNGDLFSGAEPVELSGRALFYLVQAVRKNWRNIEPSIFGTLFEGAMNAEKRSQLGAHYTSADDIMLVIEPVLMKPLRREWNAAKSNADALLADGKRDNAFTALDAFRERLANVTVLDPACGSGNFLYMALRSLLDLEKAVIDYAESNGRYGWTPRVSPSQMYGIETDAYAAELARTALWIGYIQWHQANGFEYKQDPVLMPLDTINQTDAILARDEHGSPVEPEWPTAEFIVSNPPFLGNKFMRMRLGDDAVEAIYAVYGRRLPNGSDLCCYWLEKARAQIAAGKTKRAGLLATQGIRGGVNRTTLQRIKESGCDIFAAYPDLEWVLEGAMVHISIVCFDDGSETQNWVNGQVIHGRINSDLTTEVDITSAKKLRENRGIAFQGFNRVGNFDVLAKDARIMLASPNPHGKPNSDVIKPYRNADDVLSSPSGIEKYTIDFGANMSMEEAALYELPFAYVREWVKPERDKSREAKARTNWWRYQLPSAKLRKVLPKLDRYIATGRVSKHRIFTWLEGRIMPDNALVIFASNQDYTLGVLQSCIHEIWTRAQGTQLREVESGFRYTLTTCFETFPFPHPSDEQRAAIAAAAKRLDELRRNWLHPSETDMLGNPSVGDAELRKRTLTGLYNANPAWLQNAHAALDAAVAAAYGWDADIDEQEILARLLALNLQRYAAQSDE